MKKRKLLLAAWIGWGVVFILGMGIFFLPACSKGPTDQKLRPAWITGKVTDSLSGSPLDSAIINDADTLIARDSAFTDSFGNYIDFAGAQDLRRSVFCRKAGYQPQKKMVDLVRDTTHVDFKMVP